MGTTEEEERDRGSSKKGDAEVSRNGKTVVENV